MITALALCVALAHAPPSRTTLSPTAAFDEPGVDVSLIGGVAPALTLRPSRELELGLGGTFVPFSETLFGAATKFRLARYSRLQVAGFGSVVLDVPFEGKVASFSTMGTVMTLTVGPASYSLVTSSTIVGAAGATDVVVQLAPTVAWAFNHSWSLVGEAQWRAVFPKPQAGVTLSAAIRWSWWRVDVDAGWLVDVGISGPALPLVSPPGAPVVNVRVKL